MEKGQVIADEFMLQRLFSEGPTGEVWRALELKVGRLVLLRFIPEAFHSDDTSMDRLRRHGDAVIGFRHPHVVSTERLIEQAGQTPFLVSRYVEGPFLDEYAAQWIAAEGHFPFGLIFDVLRPVADTLDEATSMYLVHRNLSPRSIIVSQSDGIQVLDFDLVGIIRERLEPFESIFYASSDRVRYFAPELFAGHSAGPLSDQYAFATIIFELLANRPLFAATDPEDLRNKILGTAPALLPNYPDHVNASLQRALHKNPSVRFPSCIHFLDGLAGQVSVAFPPSITETVRANEMIRAEMSRTGLSSVISPNRSGATAPSNVAARRISVRSGPEEGDSAASDDSVASFATIASAAQTATAKTIASKIKKERRFQKMFLAWNVLLLVGCIAAVSIFRDHLRSVWTRGLLNDIETVEPADEPAEPNFRSSEPSEKKAGSVTGRRRSRTPKEVDFTESNESSFAQIGDPDKQDEVRFLGTAGTGKKIVFVLDASGVMGNGPRTPWQHVHKEMAFSLKDLNPSQWFQVVYYNEEPDLLPGGEGPERWIPVSPEALQSAHRFLDNIQAAGKGNPVKALEKAFSLRPDVVFFLSDEKGTTLNVDEIDALKADAENIALNVVEIGEGAESKRESSLRKLAQTFRGDYKWIDGNIHGLAR